MPLRIQDNLNERKSLLAPQEMAPRVAASPSSAGSNPQSSSINGNVSYSSKRVPKMQRYLSVDILRGLTLTIMVAVNMASDGTYKFMHHAHWDNALHLADFAFPTFVFIVGISTAISTQLQRAQGHSNWAITQKAIWRSFKMAALGILVINPFGAVCDATQCYVLPLWDISSMRLPGVLQRIAMAYLITTLIVLYVPVRRSALSIFYGWAGAFHAIYGSYIFQWLVALVFPVIYIILTWGWDVPDCGRGHLSPTCNAAQYMDIQVFTEAHMYQGATCIPDCKIFDPEGIMGTLSAVLTCYMGVHIAHILQSTSNDEDEAAVASSQLTANKGLAIGVAPNKHNQWLVAQVSEKTTHMLGAAVVWAAIGITLHFTCEPINKNLWSLSYVFVMAATGTAVLWLFLMAVDAYGFKKVFSGFKWMGMNSIAIYVGSETLPNLLSMVYKGTTDKNFWWYGQQVIYSWCDEPVAGLLWSWLVALFWMGVGGILYWRRIFFKL